MSVFYRIVSVILSFIFSITGYGSLISGTPITNVKVYDWSVTGFLGDSDGNYRVFYTYDEWKAFTENISNHEMREFAGQYDEALFKEHSLVVADVMLGSSDWKVKVVSANQNIATLKINYMQVQEDMVGFQVLCFNTIFAVTEKYVAKVDLNEMEPMEIPFLIEESIPNFYSIVEANPTGEYPEEFGMKSYLFSDYESWKAFNDSGKWDFKGYADSVNEEYFETKNLVLVISTLPDSSYSLRIGYPLEEYGTLKVSCYSVDEGGVALAVEGFEVAFIETSKNAESIELTNGGDFSVPFMLDGSVQAIYW